MRLSAYPRIVGRRARRLGRLLLKRSGLRPWRVKWRHRGLGPDDVALASYPRSGNTWLRFLLYELATGQSAEFEQVHAALPYVGRHRNAPPLLPADRRLIKTHEPHPDLYSKAVYVVRDARDVALSEHKFQVMCGFYGGDFDAFLDAFLAGKVHGMGTWSEHVDRWLDARDARPDEILVLTYEGLRAETEETLARVASFLDIETSPEALRAAIRGNSLENMRKKEGRTDFSKLRDDLRHVNQGRVAGWRDKLSRQQAERIESATRETLDRLGYERPSTS